MLKRFLFCICLTFLLVDCKQNQKFIEEKKEEEVLQFPITITVKIDERGEVVVPSFDLMSIKTWGEVREEVQGGLSLLSEWQNDYSIYEWRKDDGSLMEENCKITKNITVLAITNYNKFKIEDNVLIGCDGEKPKGKIIIPNGIKKISNHAFYQCNTVTNFDFSSCSDLEEIGQFAFFGCAKLKIVELSNCIKLKNIKASAFFGCREAIVKLPFHINTIEENSFGDSGYYCKMLMVSNENIKEKVKASGYIEHRIIIGDLVFEDGFYFSNSSKKVLIICDESKEGEVSIPSSVEVLAIEAFCENKKITKLSFSNCKNLSEIQKEAYRACTHLENVDLSGCSKLKTIGEKSFYYCKMLEIKLPSSIETIGNEAFGKNDSTFCKKVFVPSKEIKEIVEDSGYRKDRIEIYQ